MPDALAMLPGVRTYRVADAEHMKLPMNLSAMAAVRAILKGETPRIQVAALRAQLPSSYAILSPYEGLPSPIVLSAWNAQVQVDSPSDPRVTEFFTAFWRSTNAPEPNAACTGALDALRRHRTQVLIIDEVQMLKLDGKMGDDAINSLKTFMNGSDAICVFNGVDLTQGL